MADIAFTKNGTLYGWAEPVRDDLHTINKSTGTATSVGNSGLSTFGSGLAANSQDVLYFTGNGPNNALRIVDKNTGQTTVVVTMSGAPLPSGAVNALAFNSHDTLYAINGGDFGPGGPAHLVIINTDTGVITDLGATLNGMDALAFLITNDPEEFAAIYEIGFAQATEQALNLQRRMDSIREGSRGFCADGLAVTTSGKDYSGGKGPLPVDGKVVLPAKEETSSVMSPAPENKWGVFITGTGQFIGVDDSGLDRPGFDIISGGFTLGVDYRVCNNFALGLYGGYAHSTADFDDQLGGFNGSEITVDGGKIGAYATWFSGGFYLDGAVGGGYNNYDTRRSDLLGIERGSTDGFEFSIRRRRLRLALALFHVWPDRFVAIHQHRHQRFHGRQHLHPRARISGSEPGLAPQHPRFALGLRLETLGKILRTESRAVWMHEFEDTAYGIDSRFALARWAQVSSPSTVGHGPRQCAREQRVLRHLERARGYLRALGYECGRKNYDNTAVSAGFHVSF